MPPATLRRRPLPLFIASSKITSPVGRIPYPPAAFPQMAICYTRQGRACPAPTVWLFAFHAVIFARIRPRKGAFSMPLSTLQRGKTVVY